jgi:hypothetical protein
MATSCDDARVARRARADGDDAVVLDDDGLILMKVAVVDDGDVGEGERMLACGEGSSGRKEEGAS